MSEPFFVKCEPGWLLDSEEHCDLESLPSVAVEVKGEPPPNLVRVTEEQETTPLPNDAMKNEEVSLPENSPAIETEDTAGSTRDHKEDDASSGDIGSNSQAAIDEVRYSISDEIYGRKTRLLESNKVVFNCDKCKKSFTRRGNLHAHMLLHTGFAPHQCPTCQKVFTLSSHLKRHILTHTGLRPHVCELCSKAFTQKENLTAHMHSHAGRRPYNCPVCNKAFMRRSHLDSHIAIHSDDKPHVCSLCEKAFNHRSALIRHIAGHSGQRLHCCVLCKKTFTQRPHLKRHMLIHAKQRYPSSGYSNEPSYIQMDG